MTGFKTRRHLHADSYQHGGFRIFDPLTHRGPEADGELVEV